MLIYKDLTDIILKSFYKVYHELGYGFLEKAYENALCIELINQGLNCETQKPIAVYYQEFEVGKYFADLLVEEKVIIELKASTLIEDHEFQLLNYLKAINIEVGLLLSFGKDPKFKRKIFTNDRKNVHI